MKGVLFILRMIALVVLAAVGLGAVLIGFDALEKKNGKAERK